MNFKKMSKNTKQRFSCTTCLTPYIKTVNDPMSKLNATMLDLLNSMSFMRNQFDDFNNKLESPLTKMKHLRIKNKKKKIVNVLLS